MKCTAEDRFYDIDYIFGLKKEVELTLKKLKIKNVDLKKKDLAKQLHFHEKYLSQVLNGYTFSKTLVIEIENWLLKVNEEYELE